MADNLLDKASILLTPTASNNGSMLSVKPENGDGDFTFSRGSAATRVNAQGLVEDVQTISSELVSNGDFSQGGQDWTFGTGWSVDQANSKAVKTSGTGSSLSQSVPVTTIGKKYKFSFDATATSGVANAELYGVTIPNFTTSGSQEHTIIATSTSGFEFYAASNFQGSITNISVKEITDDTDLPRIDYTDGCGSWLLEPQSTNLYLNSETLATQSNATSASTYTVSFYGTGTITFSGTHTGTLVGTGANDRVSATFTTTSGTLVSTVSGTCTKGQLENLSYATSYIPTNGAIATRLADVANNSGNSTLINSTEGVLYAEIAALADDGGSTRTLSLNNGTSNVVVVIRYRSDTNQIQYLIKDGINADVGNTYTLTDATQYSKAALKYKSNDISFWVDGIEVSSSTSTISLLGLNDLSFDGGDGTQNFYGKVKALAVYKEALTDAQLQSLTTQ